MEAKRAIYALNKNNTKNENRILRQYSKKASTGFNAFLIDRQEKKGIKVQDKKGSEAQDKKGSEVQENNPHL
ncbi:hypothetical protein SUGI_0825140 [Cryptomeria japonica]|nr:hypothetical protein SUGI_0825140 [Cryptomeria japonica]